MYSVPVKNYYGEEQRMDESREIEYLMHFGLSRQEALIYRKLLEGGKKTGYEIARDTGISRSNAYASLAAMVEKGAAYLVEGDAKRYIPIVPQEFCGNRIRRLEKELEWLCNQEKRAADRTDCRFPLCSFRRIWNGQHEYVCLFRSEKFCDSI